MNGGRRVGIARLRRERRHCMEGGRRGVNIMATLGRRRGRCMGALTARKEERLGKLSGGKEEEEEGWGAPVVKKCGSEFESVPMIV